MSTTDTTATPRKSAVERVTGVIWGAIVTTAGAFLIAALSGYEVDLEIIAIVALVALGGWLLASAIGVSLRQRPTHAATWDTRGPQDGSAAPSDRAEP